MSFVSTPKVCIAIPTINESDNLKILVPKLRKLLPNALIIIIDDASTDNTQVFLEQAMEKDRSLKAIFRDKRFGIGSAHLLAIEYAFNQGFEILITMDGDLTHSPEDALRLLESIKGHDLAIGSRYQENGRTKNWSPYRYFLTHAGHLMTNLFFRSDLDMSSALRAYNVRNIPLLSLKENCPMNYAFFFTSSLVYMKKKLQITQIPVTLENRASGSSKMSPRLMILGVNQLLLYGFRIKKILLIQD